MIRNNLGQSQSLTPSPDQFSIYQTKTELFLVEYYPEKMETPDKDSPFLDTIYIVICFLVSIDC